MSGHFLDLDIADIIGSDICDHRPPLRLAIRLIQTADLLSLFEFNLFSVQCAGVISDSTLRIHINAVLKRIAILAAAQRKVCALPLGDKLSIHAVIDKCGIAALFQTADHCNIGSHILAVQDCLYIRILLPQIVLLSINIE